MKASNEFGNQLVAGIRALVEKYGKQVLDMNEYQIYFAVYDSVTEGHEHNAKVNLPGNAAFSAEAFTLNDNNIGTAMRAALSKFSCERPEDEVE